VLISASKRQLLVSSLLASLAALAVSAPALADPSSVASKQAQVERVLGQVQALDASLGQAIEAYNAANVKLDRIRGELRSNSRQLGIARRNLNRSQAALSARVVSLYTSDDDTTTLGIILGSTSLDDLLSRMDTAGRVADQDVYVHRETTVYRRQVKRQRIRLRHARAEQAQVVDERAAHRASVEQQLAERQALVASIKDEIARLQAQERARQRAAAAAARRRLAAAQTAAPVLPSPVTEAVTATTDASDAPAIAAPSSSYGGVVGIAMQYLGTPYLWGGASPGGFDCSGLIMYVYAKVGVSLPHNAAAQYGYGTPVSRSQLQPGDLVFFNGLGHNGIYIGGGSFIHSPHTGDVVKISSISGWYSSTWVGARRL